MEANSLRTYLFLSVLIQIFVILIMAFVTLNEVMIAFLLLSSVVMLVTIYVLLHTKAAKAIDRAEDDVRKIAEEIISTGKYPSDLPDGMYFSELKRLGRYIERINLKYEGRKGQLEAILNSLRNGLVAIDSEGKIIFSNPRFNEMYHLRRDLKETHLTSNVYDKNILEIIDSLEKEPFVEKKFVEQTNGLIYTYRGILIASLGKTIGKIISIENVTKVANLDSMKQTFVSNVTHELKTPLTSIRGFAETLQDMNPNDEKYKEFLSIIEREAERLNNLITDILLLSELEATGQPKKAQWVEVAPLVEEVTTLVRHQLKPEVELQVGLDNDLKLYFDSFQFRQIVLNLVSNAIKYTDVGTVEIQMFEEQGRVILQVIDTGIGIPDSEQGRVFERFYRVDKDRSRATGGTGLGLSIVKHIVENNRCQIFLDSKEGKGTTVTIVFAPQPKRK